ncbi:MAG: energy transducer TonB, partial [Acidobacteriaceae bacterium]
SAPAPAKNAAPAVPGAASPAPASASSKGKDEPLPAQPVPVEPAIARTMQLPDDTISSTDARAARIEGTVVLAATIGADGAVQSVEPVSGPALLEVGALNSVRSWHYRPWLSEGRPVPFTTQIIIDFKLDTGPPQ